MSKKKLSIIKIDSNSIEVESPSLLKRVVKKVGAIKETPRPKQKALKERIN